MKKRLPAKSREASLREKIIGLGERSLRKSYYPQLQQQLVEVEQARQQLAESRALYRSLVENIPDVIISLDTRGKITYVSPVILTLCGLGPAQIIGDELVKLIHPDDQAAFQAAFAKAMCEEIVSLECRVITQHAKFRFTQVSLRPLQENDRVAGLTCIISDISERRLAEEKLRASESKYRRIVDTANEGILIIDTDDRFLFVNPGLAKMLDYEVTDITGHLFTDFMFEEDIPDHRQRMKNRRRGLSEHYERRFHARDGHTVWTLVSATPIFDESHGSKKGSFAMLTDITLRKQAEEELRCHQEQLEQTVRERTEELRLARDAAQEANKAKSIFLANMSHELRTPLNAILGFSQMMHQSTNLDEMQRDNIEIINKSGEHLLKLINDVLEIAKIEAGKLQLQIATFDLHELVREVSDMMRLRAEEKGLQLALDQSSEFPRYIKGDEARMRQILVNLISNAVKFTNQGGVTIRMSVKENKSHQLLIEIKDTGPGISTEDQQRLFQPFVQLPEGEMQMGSGLGLSIVQQFVKLMGGTIALESELGKGALFRVVLPMNEINESEVISQDKADHVDVIGLAPGQPPYRILVADDQLDNQLLLVRLMTHLGLEARSANNGEECIDVFKEWKPDLIWMDRRMPIMDGLDATRQIRQLPGGKQVKIVAVTASAFKEQQQELLNAGMDGFVSKPIRFVDIYENLSQQLGLELLYSDKSTEQESLSTTLEPEMLAGVSDELRTALRESLEVLDARRIAEIIRSIGEQDRVLAQVLSLLADNYAYPTIINALDGTTTTASDHRFHGSMGIQEEYK